jgi:hypothetical protein
MTTTTTATPPLHHCHSSHRPKCQINESKDQRTCVLTERNIHKH